jgi:hypothetical protein
VRNPGQQERVTVEGPDPGPSGGGVGRGGKIATARLPDRLPDDRRADRAARGHSPGATATSTETPRARRRSNRTSWCSARSVATARRKPEKSRRSLALPARCAQALREHRERQLTHREKAGKRWRENDLYSPAKSAPSSTPPTFGEGFAVTSRPPSATRTNGRPASYGTASCRCYPMRFDRQNLVARRAQGVTGDRTRLP